MLKRAPGLSYGGFFVYPGGLIDSPGDTAEYWQEVMPKFMEKKGKYFPDFTKRISAIRETFEEVNFLLADSNKAKIPNNTETLRSEQYLKRNKSDFC
jgi:8-oxo-dGTP pyrophosphatase MutT (NUDIX family)